MTKLLALVALASLGLLPACTMVPPGGVAVAGTQWQIVRIDGTAPAMPDKARLTFEAERLGANVGCNGMGGDYRIEAGSDGARLIAGPMMSTRMFCEGPVWAQEQAVGTLLASGPRIVRSGDTLQLDSSGHSLEAKRAP